MSQIKIYLLNDQHDELPNRETTIILKAFITRDNVNLYGGITEFLGQLF